jgi:hypothetical protein
MFTGIGALFGVLGSGINRGLSMIEAKQQAKYDKEKRSDDFELAKMSAGKESIVASYDHDKSLGQNVSVWVSNIRALVRPAITAYAFVFSTIIFFTVGEDVKKILAIAIFELLSTVVTWWFADRFKR